MTTPQQGLNNVIFDGTAGVHIVIGLKRVPFTKFSPPKVKTKVEKPRRVGQQLATVRTPGVTEIEMGSGELLLTDWAADVLPAFNVHGSNQLRVPILRTFNHPSISLSYSELYDSCRFLEEEGSETAGDEKALIVKVGIDAMNVWRRAGRGPWSCSAFVDNKLSSEAKALMGTWR